MGIKNIFKKFIPSIGEEKEEEDLNVGDTCALCQKPGADKKWMGQKWHKECLRKVRKMAKKQL